MGLCFAGLLENVFFGFTIIETRVIDPKMYVGAFLKQRFPYLPLKLSSVNIYFDFLGNSSQDDGSKMLTGQLKYGMISQAKFEFVMSTLRAVVQVHQIYDNK